jgi:hypothetical protein
MPTALQMLRNGVTRKNGKIILLRREAGKLPEDFRGMRQTFNR